MKRARGVEGREKERKKKKVATEEWEGMWVSGSEVTGVEVVDECMQVFQGRGVGGV